MKSVFLTALAALTLLAMGCEPKEKPVVREARSSINCPGECKGACEFSARLEGIKNPKACDGKGGYYSATLHLYKNTPQEPCLSDFDRESQTGTGKITWVLCDEANTKCELTARNFGPNSPYPLGPNDTIPEGKEALSEECYESLAARFSKKGRGALYTFAHADGISSIEANFDIITYCICATKKRDTARGSLGLKLDLD
ncbi:MAG: hypothetical protein KF734_07080 [Saprospiraceae bacterium]|nr:hypothetical protein [Saprospiraceae bacterium]